MKIIENPSSKMTLQNMAICLAPSFLRKGSENISHSLFVEDGYELLMIKGLFVNNHTEVIKDSYFSLSAVVNDVYGQYFSNHKPARACVQVARLPRDAKIEIEAIAVK